MTAFRTTASRVRTVSFGSPKNGSTTAVHAAVEDNGAEQKVKTAITNPDQPRNITVTAGGTEEDIKAIKVTVVGTNVFGEAISEEIGPFTVNTAGTKEGSKAFKTVTEIKIPAHDGEGATTAVGTGNKLGLPGKLSRNTVIAAYLNNVKEGTAPTVAVSSSAVESNTLKLNSTPNETAVLVDLYHSDPR